jgi:hypothetical protein
MSKTHDGKLATLVASCGLKDPLALQHQDRPFPASYFRGKNRIDFIFVTPRLLPAVERSGSLPYYSMFQGDRRPYYLDLTASIVFADNTYEIACPKGRGLQLHDPRIVTKYKDALYEQLSYHKCHEKVQELQQCAQANTWSEYLTLKYQITDTVITEIMIHAERTAGRKYSTKFDWSPTLLKAVQTFRFWKMKLKLQRGLHVSRAVLQKHHTEAALPQDAYDTQYTEAAIVQAIKDAYQELQANQKKHRELRTSYLESLAEAIVLHQSPNLEASEAAPIRIERTKHHVKQLIHREKRKRMFKKIGTTLHPHSSTGLSRVDIPDSRAQGPNLGSPDDPKTWKGHWISVTHPEEIAKIIASLNVRQYNQAQETPFGSRALADLIGRNGDTPAAKALLEGSLPDHMLSSLLPETIRILRTLATPIKQLHHHQDTLITEEEFISTFKISRSPSGRHIGHYKAIIKDPVLVSLHTNMMNIPFQVGIAPERWTKVTDIMLEKEAGNPRSHRLRILALFECDFNQAKRIIIACKTSHHIEDNKLVPGMQFGSRPGRNCQSVVLQKVISHDIVRLTRQTAAFMENDAIGVTIG